MKRKRGRPPGSKNKKTLAAEQAKATTTAAAGSSTGAGTSGEQPAKRGRGRPPKVRILVPYRPPPRVLTGVRPPFQRKPDDAAETEPQPKRKRGRPPKNKPAPPPAESGDDGDEGAAEVEEAPKKKRGRPRKDAS